MGLVRTGALLAATAVFFSTSACIDEPAFTLVDEDAGVSSSVAATDPAPPTDDAGVAARPAIPAASARESATPSGDGKGKKKSDDGPPASPCGAHDHCPDAPRK